MTVNPIPQIVVNGGEICQGSSIQLSAFGANSYSWSPSIGLNSINTQNVISTPPGSITYTVTGIDLNGCVGTGVSNVIVNQNPIVTVTSGSVCLGQSINLNANGATNYFWSPSIFLSSNSGNQVISSPNSNINYSVVGVDQNGCKDTAYSNIVVYPLSNVNFTPTQYQGCPPLTTQFFELISDSIINLSWSFGDGTYSNQSNPTHTYENSGNYYVTLEVINQYGCRSVSNFQSLVSVYPEPSANFSIFSPILDELNPLVNTINYSIGSTDYFWNFGDDAFSNSFEPTHKYENAGDYVVELIVQNEFGCKDSANVTVTIKPVFTFYIPNAFTPSKKLNEFFSGKGTNYKSVNMQIFNRWGERIFDQTSSEPPIWDGTYKGEDCQIDVYVYQFFVTDVFDELHVYRGRVTLVR
jgi:gliding motility-associated-like protein